MIGWKVNGQTENDNWKRNLEHKKVRYYGILCTNFICSKTKLVLPESISCKPNLRDLMFKKVKIKCLKASQYAH